MDRANRRHFLGAAATTVAAAGLLLAGRAGAQSDGTKAADAATLEPAADGSFASPKQVDAGLLNIGYAEAGPAGGRAVILLHGWPYDIHSYADVAPLLAAKGYRAIVPYLRGYGTTRFLSNA